MNRMKIGQAVFFLGLAVIMVSCGSSRQFPGQSPYPDRYPNYPPPPRQDGPVVIVTDPHNLPPGQAKKIYGQQSARDFARCKRNGHRYCCTHYRPAMVINLPFSRASRYPDGRYFYQDEFGAFYNYGRDGRFYLDENRFNRDFGHCENEGRYRENRYGKQNHGRKHGNGRYKKERRDDDD